VRPLPTFARRSLTRRLQTVAVSAGATPSAREVVVFADCFVQYQEPEIGEALVRLLRAAGDRVTVADVGCCGRTSLSTGRIEAARRDAGRALAGLYEHAVAGRVVAFVEPSCASMVVDDWFRLLPGDARLEAVASAVRQGVALVSEHAAAGRLRFNGGGTALLHPHCHERALFTAVDSESALRAAPGLELTVLDAGCCGMSGIFGYEAEHYETSVAIAERDLLPAVRGATPQTAVLATGTSCRTQIRDLGGRQAAHPLTFLAERLVR
jgi:Fe-S oxidoreductase